MTAQTQISKELRGGCRVTSLEQVSTLYRNFLPNLLSLAEPWLPSSPVFSVDIL